MSKLLVRAKELGYYGEKRRRPTVFKGQKTDEFYIESEQELGTWMEPIGWEPKDPAIRKKMGLDEAGPKPKSAAKTQAIPTVPAPSGPTGANEVI